MHNSTTNECDNCCSSVTYTVERVTYAVGESDTRCSRECHMLLEKVTYAVERVTQLLERVTHAAPCVCVCVILSLKVCLYEQLKKHAQVPCV